MKHLHRIKGRFHGFFRPSSIVVVEDSKENYRGKIINMTEGRNEFKDYADAEHMISSIVNAFSVNKSKKNRDDMIKTNV